MRRALPSAAALVVVLAVPFVARSTRVRPDTARAKETLVILTPHNESIRFEFGRAFREHMARLGRDVDIDWRWPGGTAEITRYLSSELGASFQRHWTQDSSGGRGRRPSPLASRARRRCPRRAATSATRPAAPSSPRTSAAASTCSSAAAAPSSASTPRRAASSTPASSRVTPSSSAQAASRRRAEARRTGTATAAGSGRACRPSASATTATSSTGSA